MAGAGWHWLYARRPRALWLATRAWPAAKGCAHSDGETRPTGRGPSGALLQGAPRNGSQGVVHLAQVAAVVHLLVDVILQRPPRRPALRLPHLRPSPAVHFSVCTSILEGKLNSIAASQLDSIPLQPGLTRLEKADWICWELSLEQAQARRCPSACQMRSARCPAPHHKQL